MLKQIKRSVVQSGTLWNKAKKLYIGTENIAQHRKRMLCGKLKKLRGSNTYEVQHSFFFMYIYLFSMYICLEKT